MQKATFLYNKWGVPHDIFYFFTAILLLVPLFVFLVWVYSKMKEEFPIKSSYGVYAFITLFGFGMDLSFWAAIGEFFDRDFVVANVFGLFMWGIYLAPILFLLMIVNGINSFLKKITSKMD